MKNILCFLFLLISLFSWSQKKTATRNINSVQKKAISKIHPDLQKINDSIPALIPQKKDGKYGFINQKGKVIIKHEYSNVGFFAEDCNLLNSPSQKARKYGSSNYASVRLNGVDFRINQAGKRVYLFRDDDLGVCDSQFKVQLFHAYILNNVYGIIEDSKFENPGDYRQFTIYPQYNYLHIMEGDDLKNPMIIASKAGKFGVLDVNHHIIIPFEYVDIKRNFSWKLARLFEVTKDGTNYFYIDAQNNAYY